MAYILKAKPMIYLEIEGIEFEIEMPYVAKRRLLDEALNTVSTDEKGRTTLDMDFGTAADIVITHCKVEWSGVEDEAGESVPFTKERGKALPVNILLQLGTGLIGVLFGEEEELKNVL